MDLSESYLSWTSLQASRLRVDFRVHCMSGLNFMHLPLEDHVFEVLCLNAETSETTDMQDPFRFKKPSGGDTDISPLANARRIRDDLVRVTWNLNSPMVGTGLLHALTATGLPIAQGIAGAVLLVTLCPNFLTTCDSTV